jgi:hypothetical protein
MMKRHLWRRCKQILKFGCRRGNSNNLAIFYVVSSAPSKLYFARPTMRTSYISVRPKSSKPRRPTKCREIVWAIQIETCALRSIHEGWHIVGCAQYWSLHACWFDCPTFLLLFRNIKVLLSQEDWLRTMGLLLLNACILSGNKPVSALFSLSRLIWGKHMTKLSGTIYMVVSISWILTHLGFSQSRCVTCVRYAVRVNGELTEPVVPFRGIRQGNPISPYLFLLCTEGLSCLLQKKGGPWWALWNKKWSTWSPYLTFTICRRHHILCQEW